jgi:hypothetical protein
MPKNIYERMNFLDKPNFYSITPANVRYDKNLSDKAKLLYGEITALTSVEGYCWATNKYFAELYDVSERTVTRLIAQLEEGKYIRVELTKNGYKTVRKLYLTEVDKNVYVEEDKNVYADIDKNVYVEVDKNVVHINTSFINTSNNTSLNDLTILCENEPKPKKAKKPSIPKSQLEQEFEDLWKLYPNKKGKSKAFTSYETARKNGKVTFEQVENGILLYKQYIEFKNLESNFIKNGSTYFNQHSWNDEYDFTKKVVSAKDYIREKYFGGGNSESRRERKIIGYDS